MPKVPERKLSYGEILENNRRSSRRSKSLATKDFAEVKDTRKSKKAQTGYIKVKKKKQPKEVRKAFKDNYLLSNQYRRIMNGH